jgi:hypothetical protein
MFIKPFSEYSNHYALNNTIRKNRGRLYLKLKKIEAKSVLFIRN